MKCTDIYKNINIKLRGAIFDFMPTLKLGMKGLHGKHFI